MSNASKSRKRVKPERRVQMSKIVNGGFAIAMTIGSGETAKQFNYFVEPIPADFGLGFHFEKFIHQQVEGEPSEYDVNIDLQRGYHSCTCKGNTYCGHCKHVESILALIKSGKIAVPAERNPPPNRSSLTIPDFPRPRRAESPVRSPLGGQNHDER